MRCQPGEQVPLRIGTFPRQDLAHGKGPSDSYPREFEQPPRRLERGPRRERTSLLLSTRSFPTRPMTRAREASARDPSCGQCTRHAAPAPLAVPASICKGAQARTGLAGDRVAAEPELAQGGEPVQLVDARPLPNSLCASTTEGAAVSTTPTLVAPVCARIPPKRAGCAPSPAAPAWQRAPCRPRSARGTRSGPPGCPPPAGAPDWQPTATTAIVRSKISVSSNDRSIRRGTTAYLGKRPRTTSASHVSSFSASTSSQSVCAAG